jgi:hypothetical protein
MPNETAEKQQLVLELTPPNESAGEQQVSDLIPEDADSLATRLLAIGYSNRKEVINAARDWLLRHCRNLAEAVWVIDAALDTLEEWKSFKDLDRLYCAKFNPAPAHQTVQSLPEPPSIVCSKCNDSGVSNDGRPMRCDCAQGPGVSAEYLAMAQESFDASNSQTARPFRPTGELTETKLVRMGCGKSSIRRRSRAG